jgi:predicted alpha/beta hydrolase
MSMSEKLTYESMMVPVPSTHQVHMMRFYKDKDQLGPPVFMVHSNLADGKIFYDDGGGGLARYLANRGYDVYVADLRGKGKSWPKVNGYADYGNHQLINEDIPALLSRISKKRGPVPQIWVSHGWGGVLLCAYYARYGESACEVSKMVYFGVRRQSVVSNANKNFFIEFMWKRLSRFFVSINGYMPARLLRLGTANESKGNFSDFIQWSNSQKWYDLQDGFCYGEAIQNKRLPPSYYFAAKGDKAYGHPDDVRGFLKELGPHDARMMVLSRQGGNLRDYNHIDMLQHQDCEQDHFPLLLNWLQQA